MAKTNLDQIVDYPAKIIKLIAQDSMCCALFRNKSQSNITEDDMDAVLDENLYDYQYVDNSIQEATSCAWIEMEVNSVENQQIKDVDIYVTVACHKELMELKTSIFKGVHGNRRDNIVRYIDNLLNGKMVVGIGELRLESMRTLAPINGFTLRELKYSIPDFNVVK